MKNLNKAMVIFLLISLISGCTPVQKWEQTQKDDIIYITNEGGEKLAYSSSSGVTVLEDRGFAFKDLNRNGILDKYEDWRLSPRERAEDLASAMSIEQIAGLMLYSGHQSIPAGSSRFASTTYNGKPYDESGAEPWELSDQQRQFLVNDNLRHVLITSVQSPEVAARWNNTMQALVEGSGFGIPANNSSDPRHGTVASAEFNAGAGGNISMWPNSLGLAATFDPDLVFSFAQIASREYRALGIATTLSPQIDLATDPRWMRVSGTFGEDPGLTTDMAGAYVEGFQSTVSSVNPNGAWGNESVNAMVKHWPGGGTGEGGRDAHFGYGKYAVYPGNNFDVHLMPFTEGAFNTGGGTGVASAVMPYYTISFGQDEVYGENVGNAFSKYILTDLLREKYRYEGVVCTDWGVTRDVTALDQFGNSPHGIEHLTVAERHYKGIMAGVDQFGGNNDAGPVIEAYNMGIAEHGEEYIRARFERSAVRLLLNIFKTGLFENPYLDIETTLQTVGNPDFMLAGYEAQIKSMVMVKNQDETLPAAGESKVFIPQRLIPERYNYFGMRTPERLEFPVNMDIAAGYFQITDNPGEADYAFVFIESPDPGSGYSREDIENGGNGYVPKTLQYEPYTATFARDPSIAGGDPLEDFTNRTYKGKSVTATNTTDLELIKQTRAAMGDKPVVVIMRMANPSVFSEFETLCNAILVHFGVQDQAIMDILAGNAEPTGLLPVQMPANMRTVEEQSEDLPHDMEVYRDSSGNYYDFGYGLNWNGVISDSRTAKYSRK